MLKPPFPDNEKNRIQSLQSLGILDTPEEHAYNYITKLVSLFFDVPITAISMVDSERQWFKSIQGLDVCETGRDVSFCGHAILQDEIFVIEDALKDERFKDNPLVLDDPKIRFYAGFPLKSASGYALGTLCIIDTKPRQFSVEKLNSLKQFAFLIEKEFFEKRKATAYLAQISKIQEMYISGRNQREIFDYILDFLLKHTSSEYGFIGSILKDKDDAPYLKTYAITDISWDEETRKFYESQAPDGMEFRNLDTLFGCTIKAGELVVSNDPANDIRAGGLPEGHPNLNRYLGVPIYGKEGLIAMYGLANRPQGYDDSIIKDLLAITKIMTAIIESVRNLSLIDKMSKVDALTGCYNRAYLEKHVNNLVENTNEKFCILMVDFDDFKKINDYYGHPFGDKLLEMFADRISGIIKQSDMLSRIGGDEFIIVLQNLDNYINAGKLSNRIVDACKIPYEIEGRSVNLSVSCGIASYPVSGKNYHDLIKNVDIALYEAKKEKSNCVFFSDDLNTKFINRLNLEKDIIAAFESKAFYCMYQPQINIKTRKLSGIEALLRWDTQEPISPEVFVSVIESMGLSEKLNEYVINRVANDFFGFDLSNTPLHIAINVSPNVRNFEEHIAHLSDICEPLTQKEAVTVEFELTENAMFDIDVLKPVVMQGISSYLRSKGVLLTVDDFGIKYSSLNRLLDFSFSTIKIDRSFVGKIGEVDASAACVVIHAIIELAKNLNLTVVAEGVETEAQIKVLEGYGCDTAQGYYFHRPMKLDAFKKLLQHADN